MDLTSHVWSGRENFFLMVTGYMLIFFVADKCALTHHNLERCFWLCWCSWMHSHGPTAAFYASSIEHRATGSYIVLPGDERHLRGKSLRHQDDHKRSRVFGPHKLFQTQKSSEENVKVFICLICVCLKSTSKSFVIWKGTIIRTWVTIRWLLWVRGSRKVGSSVVKTIQGPKFSPVNSVWLKARDKLDDFLNEGSVFSYEAQSWLRKMLYVET